MKLTPVSAMFRVTCEVWSFECPRRCCQMFAPHRRHGSCRHHRCSGSDSNWLPRNRGYHERRSRCESRRRPHGAITDQARVMSSSCIPYRRHRRCHKRPYRSCERGNRPHGSVSVKSGGQSRPRQYCVPRDDPRRERCFRLVVAP